MGKRFELKSCPDGNYYLLENKKLYIGSTGYISFDLFNKESAESLINLLNEQDKIMKKLNKQMVINLNRKLRKIRP